MIYFKKKNLIFTLLILAFLFFFSFNLNAAVLYDGSGNGDTTVSFTLGADAEVNFVFQKMTGTRWDFDVYDSDGNNVLSIKANSFWGKTYSDSVNLNAGNYDAVIDLTQNYFWADDSFNLTITSEASDVIYYEDSDGDGYGNQDVTTTAPVGSPPAGYVDNYEDCDDTDPDVSPDSSEICDLKDNDCDGDIDEGFDENTYYRDSDGDGYGNPDDSITGCMAPPNYVEDNTDCNDNNSNIHPGAYDPCDTPEDENCSGSNADCSSEPVSCRELANYPLETEVESADPMLIFVMDDSGSMAWDVLCPANNGLFGGHDYVSDVKNYWKSQWAGYNGVYYDPELNYSAWPGKEDADPDNPPYYPGSSGTESMDDSFYNWGSSFVNNSHYYVYSSIDNAPYLVNLSSTGVEYYKIDASGFYGEIDDFTLVASPPSDVEISRTVAEERQNFANWFTYYKNRQRTAISALAKVIDTVSDIKIGLHAINGGNSVTLSNLGLRQVNNYKTEILEDLYKVRASGGTPLRNGLKAAGEYYSADSSPYDSDADGGSCQQAFSIVMTDGYYNGGSPSVGNTDGDNNTDFDGHPYDDTHSNTLADVSMHYYENDLNTNLNDNVHTTLKDTASHQHMVTFTVSFGLTGTINYENYPTVNSFPDDWTWPYPNSDEEKIDDLFHAGVNGRGSYLAAKNAEQLASTLTNLMQEIQSRTGSGASVALNTDTLETDTFLFQGSYNSAGWTGDLKAYSIDQNTGDVADVPTWSAAAKLDALSDPVALRNIFTIADGSGTFFQHSNLTAYQKSTLGADTTEQQDIINYLKGEYNSSFRSRATILGDIVHSAPLYHENTLYVGANDGMIHAFDGDTGDELFAYIPSFAYDYGKLKELADPEYQHRYFVDGTAFVKEISSSKTILVSGLGKGGKGYFALNVNDPENFEASDVLWEYPNTSSTQAELDNMGYSFSKPAVIRTENPVTVNSNTYNEVIIFGNGYDSDTGKAALYILTTDGELVKLISTEYGSSSVCNGLSTPVAIDDDNNGKADFIYAGDMQGNLWKFDIRSADISDWDVYFEDSSSVPKPLFQAKDASGNPQPITSKPAIMRHCEDSGYIVVFGTGSFNAVDDFDDSKIQSIYGIWDWSKKWEQLKAEDSTITISDKYYGSFMEPVSSKRLLSNIESKTYFSDVDLTLLSQSITYQGDKWGTSSSNEINWFNIGDYDDAKSDGETYVGGEHAGWYLDLDINNGERVIADASIRGGLALMVTLDPSSSPCETGGNSYLRVFNACSGALPDDIIFDTDDDDDLSDEKANYETLGLPTHPGSIKLDDIYYKPVALGKGKLDKLYFGNEEYLNISGEARGMSYWRIINR